MLYFRFVSVEIGDFLENLLAEVRGSLGTLPGIGNAGIGIDVALRQLGQIDFTDFGSLKGQFQVYIL